MFNEEIVLIFGGMSKRNKTFGSDKKKIFDNCEDYSILTGLVTLEDRLKNCGEELLNDMWRYHVARNIWTPVKYYYNTDT